MMDEDRIKSEGGIEAPSEEYITQDYFESVCRTCGFTYEPRRYGCVCASKNGKIFLIWDKGKVGCYNQYGVFCHTVNTVQGLTDAIVAIDKFLGEDTFKREGGIEAPNEVHWHDERPFVKSDIMKEFEDVTNTDNYHGVRGEFEPIRFMEYIMIEYAKRNIPPEKALMVAIAGKYLLRAGTKDDFNTEMFKAINFITRARYAKWLPCDFNKKMGGE